MPNIVKYTEKSIKITSAATGNIEKTLPKGVIEYTKNGNEFIVYDRRSPGSFLLKANFGDILNGNDSNNPFASASAFQDYADANFFFELGGSSSASGFYKKYDLSWYPIISVGSDRYIADNEFKKVQLTECRNYPSGTTGQGLTNIINPSDQDMTLGRLRINDYVLGMDILIISGVY